MDNKNKREDQKIGSLDRMNENFNDSDTRQQEQEDNRGHPNAGDSWQSDKNKQMGY